MYSIALGHVLLHSALVIILTAEEAPQSAAPPVGIAWSGGGLTAFFATQCAVKALAEISPKGEMYNGVDYAVAANSGGALGYMLMVSAPPGHLNYPPSWSPSDYTLSMLLSKFDTPGSHGTWFAKVNDFVPSAHNLSMPSQSLEGSKNQSWWLDALRLAVRLYGLKEPMAPGPRAAAAGVGLLRAAATPIKRNANGVMFGADDNLLPGEFDLHTGVLSAVGNSSGMFPPVSAVSVLSGSAMTSAYWADGIIEMKSKKEFDIAKTALISPVQGWYSIDGGFVDTSGIPMLLRRKVRRMVVMENKNQDLTVSSSTFGYLFGVTGPTDAMNTIVGPELVQVFDSTLYPQVMRNLTDGSLHAVLRNVQVRANSYLGVDAYVVDLMVIIANEYSEEFIGEFQDPEIRKRLDSRWPSNFPVGMSTLDANMLCIYSGWKIRKFSALLTQVFSSSFPQPALFV